jgi:hypothetical protein
VILLIPALRIKAARAWIILALSLTPACGSVDALTSNAYLSEGLRGKTWGAASEIEPRPAAVSALDPRTFNRFDAASEGTYLYAGAGFFEADSELFEAQILRYEATTGWKSTGDGTLQYSLGAGNDVGLFKLLEDTLGGRILHVGGERGDATFLNTSLLQGVHWENPKGASFTGGIPEADLLQNEAAFGSDPISVAFDSSARGHIAFNDGSRLQLHVRDSGETTGIDTAESFSTLLPNLTSLSSSGAATRDFKMVSDGAGWTCAFYRDSPGSVSTSLKSTCFLGDKTGASTTTLLEGVGEFDAAASSDSSDALMLLVVRPAGEDSLLSFAVESESGALSVAAEANLVFEEYPEGEFGLPADNPDASDGELLPGVKVAYIGEGRFLAVWAAIAAPVSGSSGFRIRLYSAVYEHALGVWREPEWIGELEESFSARIKYSGLVLKAQPNGNAVLALNRVLLEGEQASEDIRDVLVSRFHINEGWMPLKELGDGCGRFIIDGVNSTRECTQPPSLALTRSGDAAVVFADQDESGLFRLKASVFE